MKRNIIFTALFAAIVMCSISFSGCYTSFAALPEDEPGDQWAERWSGWYVQDLQKDLEPEYPNTVIVNRCWNSTDMRAFHRNVYDWYRGCWVLEPEFCISIGWTDGWFDWDFGWDWVWDREYRPAFWHPPVWAYRAWNPPMAHCGWRQYSVWPQPVWGGWHHSTAYAYDYHNHSDWMNPPVIYPDQPRIQNRRPFESKRGTDLRPMERVETAAWEAPAKKETQRRIFVERSDNNRGTHQTAASDRLSVQNSRRSERQTVQRENRNNEPIQIIQPRTPNPESRFPNSEARTTMPEARTSNREFRTPNSDSQITPHTSRLTAPEARTTKPEARTSRRESRTTNPQSRIPKTEFRTPNSESRFTPHASRLTAPEAQSTKPEARSSRREFRTPNSDSRITPHDSRVTAPAARSTMPDARSTNPERRRR